MPVPRLFQRAGKCLKLELSLEHLESHDELPPDPYVDRGILSEWGVR
jgi:hypothetical protein